MFESSSAFLKGLTLAQQKLATKGKGKGAALKGVNALLGLSTHDLDAPPSAAPSTGPEATELLQRVASALAGFGPSDMVTDPGSVKPGDTQFLRRLVAALQGSSRGPMDAAWVAQHGLVGFPAPTDPMRGILHGGKVLWLLGTPTNGLPLPWRAGGCSCSAASGPAKAGVGRWHPAYCMSGSPTA